jgi:hypothetical protein
MSVRPPPSSRWEQFNHQEFTYMKLSQKITKIISTAAILGMLAAPALASTTIDGAHLAGNGHGPGDGTGTGDSSQDGTGNGPGDGDCLGVFQYTLDNTLLLARGGNGNGNGNGNGGSSGNGGNGGHSNGGENGGNSSGDQDGDRDRDRDRDDSSLT